MVRKADAVQENSRWHLTDFQRLVVVLAIACAIFLSAISLGAQSIIPLLIAMLLVVGAGLGVFLLGLRMNGRAMVQGHAYVLMVNPPPVGKIVARCDMRLLVDMPGQAQNMVKFRDSSVPVTKWPTVGMTLPVEVSPRNPRQLRVRWENVDAHASRVSAAAEADAEPATPFHTQFSDHELKALTGSIATSPTTSLSAEPPLSPTPMNPVRAEPPLSPTPMNPLSAELPLSPTPPTSPTPQTSPTPTMSPTPPVSPTPTLSAMPPLSPTPPSGATGSGRPSPPWRAAPVDGAVDETPDDDYTFAGDLPTVEPHTILGDEIVIPPHLSADLSPEANNRASDYDLPLRSIPQPRPAESLAERRVAAPTAAPSVSEETRPEDDMPAMGMMLVVSDLVRSLRFYRDLVGFNVIDNGANVAVLGYGGGRILLRQLADMSPVDRRVAHLHITVADVDAAYKDLKDRGVEFVHRPRITSRGDKLDLWAATFRDPDGHDIALTQWRTR